MRRSNGYGTVTKLNGSWRAPYAVRVPGIDRRGYICQKYLSYYATVSEAQKALDEYNRQATAGQAPPPDKLSITLLTCTASGRRVNTPKRARHLLQAIRLPGRACLCWVGGMHMRELTIDELQAVFDRDEQAGLSKSSIQNDKILMRAIFRFAMERDIVMKDYSEFVELPTVAAKHEKGAFTQAQLRQIEQLAAEGFPYADTVLMLCYTGFRITEFLTLTPASYDAKADALRGGLKTAAGKNRIVPVHPKIKPYLKRGGERIICTPDGKPFSSSGYRATAFRPVMQQMGVKAATPHWCRHIFASRLHAAGAPGLDIKRLMGHADKDVTEHYTHIDVEHLRKAVYLLQ